MNAATFSNRHRPPRARTARLLRSPVALAVAAALCGPSGMATAGLPPGTLPSGTTETSVVGGSAVARINLPDADHPNLMTVAQSTRGAIINWASFNVGSAMTVQFQQPDATSVTLNRDLSGALSSIEGAITAPGRIFIVNPAGVTFGAGSRISVGGLVASAMTITDGAFNAGVAGNRFVFDNTALNKIVSNDGTITVRDFGTAALLGSQIYNTGTISAPQGTIALGAGSQVTLDIGGDGLTQMLVRANTYEPTARNYGALVADGGQVLMKTAGYPGYPGSIANEGTIRARSLTSRNGVVVLSSESDGGNADTVRIESGGIDVTGTAAGVSGGSIAVSGGNVRIGALSCDGGCPPSVLDASGATGGGTITVDAREVAELDVSARFKADALATGSGGTIRANGAGGGLYALGSFSARGGAAGGNGGSIETSGNGLYLNGISVDARAPNGTAGTWTIDPYDVTIVHGSATGSLPTLPFTPIAGATIQDGDINAALTSGSSVTITTGTGSGPAAGNITIDGTAAAVDVVSNWNGPLTFRLDADAAISGGNFTIESTTGPLAVIFNSDAHGTNHDDGYISLTGAHILTNGGDVRMFGQSDPMNGYATSYGLGGIRLLGTEIDTQIGREDANPGGSVTLRGDSAYARCGYGLTACGYAVTLLSSSIDTSSGALTVIGNGNGGIGDFGNLPGSGVFLGSVGDAAGSRLQSTSGGISIIGIGTNPDFSQTQGVYLGRVSIASDTGSIDVRGHGAANGVGDGGPVFNNGLTLAGNDIEAASIRSTSGDIRLTGSSLGSGYGISNAAGVDLDDRATSGGTVDAGPGNVGLRAHNDGLSDAIAVGGSVAGRVLDLRPGSVDALGTALENPTDAIQLGGSTGFGITQAELGNLTANSVVFGSDVQAGAITVVAPIVFGHDLTLQTGAGGGIAINDTLTLPTHTLALLTAGAISQTGAITARSLLARSTGGGVLLNNAANNVSASTLAGSGATGFTFVNSGTVGIGPVSAYGFSAASDAATVQSGTGIASGGNVLVRALGGNMLLNGSVSGGASVDLVSTGTFGNAGGNTVSATGTWRIWGNTWIGETRGGVVGSGPLPNLYGCTYAAGCTSGITLPAADNHFIYTRRPTLTVDLNDATREYGLPNGAITYGVTGLILGDLAGNALTGTTTTTATQASNVGTYPVTGTFTSPAGYVVAVAPGTLAVTPATLAYVAGPYTRTYGDSNGVLTGTVTGFRLGDTLASATAGTLAWTTPALQTSGVGTYAITGSGLGAENYIFAQAPGNATALTITPATLTYRADPYGRYVGTPTGLLGGGVTGFRNGDTLEGATTGILTWSTPAGTYSPVGSYAINGTGLLATNYVFAQDAANATALTVWPLAKTYTVDAVRDPPASYVYDLNFQAMPMCAATDLLATRREQDGDNLTREWSRVRTRPNLANCVTVNLENGCDSF